MLSVDDSKQRVALGLKQMTEDPWFKAIPDKYLPGQIVKGKVTKITNFGVFVELEPDLEGLLHVSELSDQKVDTPQEVVKVSEEIEVKILRVDIEDRKIGLSLKRAQWAAEDDQEQQEKQPQRGGLDSAIPAVGLGDAALLQQHVQQVDVPSESPETEMSVAPTDSPSESTESADIPTEDVAPSDSQPESTESADIPTEDVSGAPEVEAAEKPASPVEEMAVESELPTTQEEATTTENDIPTAETLTADAPTAETPMVETPTEETPAAETEQPTETESTEEEAPKTDS